MKPFTVISSSGRRWALYGTSVQQLQQLLQLRGIKGATVMDHPESVADSRLRDQVACFCNSFS